MRVKTPEISWHDTTPVYSCDFQPLIERSGEQEWSRLVTCGRDNVIRLWRVPLTSAQPEFLSSLRRHDKPVNVVRFCPNGKNLLASGGDDGVVILWKREGGASAAATASAKSLFGQEDEEEETSRETWQVRRVLRLHLEDVYDLSWSSTGDCLVSGSVDQSVIEWNLKSGQQLLLKDHKAYVQGVAWDPRDEYVLSLGSDRSCRVYRVGSRNCSYNVVRHEKQRLFQDDSWKSFFRRLSYSPDGALLVCPSGCIGGEAHGAYVFTRQSLPSPVLALPTDSRPAVAVRFCPTPFALPEGVIPLFGLPYVWVFCLVLEDGLLFYNTVSKHPIAYVGGIHYQALNDCSWSADGRLLVTCSTDGYCSLVRFDPDELGQPSAEKANIAAALAREMGTEVAEVPRKRKGETVRKAEEAEAKKEPLKPAIRSSPCEKANKGLKVKFANQEEDKITRKEVSGDSVKKENSGSAVKKRGIESSVKEAKEIPIRRKETDRTSVKKGDSGNSVKKEKESPAKKEDNGSAIKKAGSGSSVKKGDSGSSVKKGDSGSSVKETKEIPIRKKAADRSSVKEDSGSVAKKANSGSSVTKKFSVKRKASEVCTTMEIEGRTTKEEACGSSVTKTSSNPEESKEEHNGTSVVAKPSAMNDAADRTSSKPNEQKISVVTESSADRPPGKKRRVTFVTLGSGMERSEAVPATAAVAAAPDGSGESSGEVPRKRRVTITTLSSEPGGGRSPMQPMKRRVPLTTLSHSVSPDDTTDNLSNMSAPEFQLHLEDSNPPRATEDVSNQPPQ